MWNAPKNTIPASEIIREHIRVLKEAVADCELYDVRTGPVYDALDALEALSNRSWGFTVFRQGLERWSPEMLREGLRLIHEHLGR
jgi:hypothetical protein